MRRSERARKKPCSRDRPNLHCTLFAQSQTELGSGSKFIPESVVESIQAAFSVFLRPRKINLSGLPLIKIVLFSQNCFRALRRGQTFPSKMRNPTYGGRGLTKPNALSLLRTWYIHAQELSTNRHTDSIHVSDASRSFCLCGVMFVAKHNATCYTIN